ncbi:hypothetical protein B7C51_16475 [Paenibacillus larvae subsp. pulvifaciens]|uniref:Uncharacterized protein n=1 Tax=Paenibacillus larvae subsp. pulvifaciens TaxID=1477 RepID=A0A1V0UVW3_9BACL|nr:hypothetical protein [Paenibacillus larvae]ARF69060.1 hypothetical protein B7C51_16475 [Paenibacillus larvae subsp. pulvifaciens]
MDLLNNKLCSLTNKSAGITNKYRWRNNDNDLIFLKEMAKNGEGVDTVRRKLKRFIGDGISEALKQEKTFDEEFSEVSARIHAGRETMKEATKNRCLFN